MLFQIGRVMYISGNPLDSAQYYYDQAREKSIEINDPYLLSTVSASQAAILRAGNQSALAKQLLFSTIQEYKQGIIPLEWHPLLSYIYLDLKQIDSARYYLHLLLQDARATPKQRAGTFAILRNVEEQAGNYQTALHYAARYKSLSDTISQTLHDQRNRSISTLWDCKG